MAGTFSQVYIQYVFVVKGWENLLQKPLRDDITHAIFKIQEISFPSINGRQTIVRHLDALQAETQKLEEKIPKGCQDYRKNNGQIKNPEGMI